MSIDLSFAYSSFGSLFSAVNQFAGAQWHAVSSALRVSESRVANPRTFCDFSERSDGQRMCSSLVVGLTVNMAMPPVSMRRCNVCAEVFTGILEAPNPTSVKFSANAACTYPFSGADDMETKLRNRHSIGYIQRKSTSRPRDRQPPSE